MEVYPLQKQPRAEALNPSVTTRGGAASGFSEAMGGGPCRTGVLTRRGRHRRALSVGNSPVTLRRPAVGTALVTVGPCGVHGSFDLQFPRVSGVNTNSFLRSVIVTLEYSSCGNDLKFNFIFNFKIDVLAKCPEARHVCGVCRTFEASLVRRDRLARKGPGPRPRPRGWRERRERPRSPTPHSPGLPGSCQSAQTHFLVLNCITGSSWGPGTRVLRQQGDNGR